MRLPISIWQGCSDNWQSAFIRENLMTLGYMAWQGYLTHGRGLVACKVAVTERALPTVSGNAMRDNAKYIPASEVATYLKRYNLKADVTNRLLEKVQIYCPEREILVSMEGKGQLNINLLNNLAIAPPDCYRQVCNRWEEFYLKPRSTETRS